MANTINQILESWSNGNNVLLYGPPGTGKTRILSKLFHELQKPTSDPKASIIDSASTMALPLIRPKKEIPIPMPAKVVWTTFHQSYTYEDFVLGLKPSTENGSMRLEPWAGVLLDAALELADVNSRYESVVLFIDEINRGNAARIFGEFMTFLDFDYRAEGAFPLPVPLRQLAYTNNQSEEIHRPNGGTTRIDKDFLFPKNIYIVATMNSVDRAAVPIDSALARRFDRIHLKPSEQALVQYWSIPFPPKDKKPDNYSAHECSVSIFNRLNDAIASELGPEFELGHGLFMALKPKSRDIENSWIQLAKTWDENIFPQLEDRFSGRPDVMIDLLKANNPPAGGEYAWKIRENSIQIDMPSTLAPVSVSELDHDTIIRSFRWLAK